MLGKLFFKIFILFSFIFVSLFIVGLHIQPIVEYSSVVHFSDGTVMKVFLNSKGYYRYYLPLEEIDPLFVKATVCYEDKRFFYHPGVDPLAIGRAALQNLKAGHVISGASTITLQLVRLLRPAPRTYWVKIKEALKALALETVMRKKRILETYLNLAPYGKNIEGVGAASLYYFGKLPEDLDIKEIAFLVSLPQSPQERNQRYRISLMKKVVKRMVKCGLIDSKAKEITLSDLNFVGSHKIPQFALHVAEYLKEKYRGRNHIFSTIDRGIQGIVERIVTNHKERLYHLGAHQASVVVISNKDRAIRALVGSVDYWDREHSGQVKGFNARRSTGSTLKPFLYALALQNGIITPETKLQDVSKIYGSFKPTNFSGEERVLVRAKKALKLSLNLPFIDLMQETGKERFFELLRAFGCRWEKSPGLTAITGGIETTLLHLTNMYVSLLRNGRYGKPKFLLKEKIKENKLIHPGAAFLTIKAMATDDFPFDMAIKTGTSFGRRDAWAIGISPNYAVGVWVGNFNGTGSRGIVGAWAALPILKDVMNEIEKPGERFHIPDEHLRTLEVCPDSGMPVGRFCLHKVRTLFPKGVIPPVPCQWHRVFMVEKNSGFRACPFKQYPSGSVQARIFLLLPWSQPPPFGPDCSIFSGKAENYEIRIVKPVNMRTYFTNGGSYAVIPIKARLPEKNSGERIFWFVNGKFKRVTRGTNVSSIQVPFGSVELEAITERGSWDKIRIWIVNTKLKLLDTKHFLSYSQKTSDKL